MAEKFGEMFGFGEDGFNLMSAINPFSIGSIVGVGKMIGGALQRRAARKRREKALENFRYDIPSATNNLVQLAQEQASLRGIPGQDITTSLLQSEQARTLEGGESVAESPSDILGLYAQTYAKAGDTYRKMLEYGEGLRERRQGQLQNAMQQYADAQQQQFHYNRYVPFMAEMGYAGQQSAGGAQNIASGMQTAYGGLTSPWLMNQYKDIYSMGNQGDVVDPTVFPSDKQVKPIEFQHGNPWA